MTTYQNILDIMEAQKAFIWTLHLVTNGGRTSLGSYTPTTKKKQTSNGEEGKQTIGYEEVSESESKERLNATLNAMGLQTGSTFEIEFRTSMTSPVKTGPLRFSKEATPEPVLAHTVNGNGHHLQSPPSHLLHGLGENPFLTAHLASEKKRLDERELALMHREAALIAGEAELKTNKRNLDQEETLFRKKIEIEYLDKEDRLRRDVRKAKEEAEELKGKAIRLRKNFETKWEEATEHFARLDKELESKHKNNHELISGTVKDVRDALKELFLNGKTAPPGLSGPNPPSDPTSALSEQEKGLHKACKELAKLAFDTKSPAVVAALGKIALALKSVTNPTGITEAINYLVNAIKASASPETLLQTLRDMVPAIEARIKNPSPPPTNEENNTVDNSKMEDKEDE